MAPDDLPEEGIAFPKDRISRTEALEYLGRATGLSHAHLTEQIPELTMDHLAFGISWPSEGFDQSHEVGRFNATAVRDFLALRIPQMNVAGDGMNDLRDLNTSYAINVRTGEIRGFPDFYGVDYYLAEHFATARVSNLAFRTVVEN